MATMSHEGHTHNATFDPYAQTLVVTLPDGVTQADVPIWLIWDLQNTTLDTAVILGVQMGISAILLTVLAVMTRPEKRRSIVFFLNIAALLFLLIRSVLGFVTLHGAFYNFYNWVTGRYRDVDGDMRLSVTADVLNSLVVVAVELSLLFQVRVVCCTLKARWRLIVTGISAFVCAGVCAVRFAYMVYNIELGITQVHVKSEKSSDVLGRMGSTNNVCIMVSIIFFSAIFVTKLGHAIYQRRSMGMTQFGPMQIIFVMGCQTMFIPGESLQRCMAPTRAIPTDISVAIFGILAYWVAWGSQIQSLMPCVVATFLPLSSMWASTNINNVNIAAPHHVNRNRNIVVGSVGKSETNASHKQLLTADTLVGDDCPKKPGVHFSSPSDRDSIDLEMHKTGNQIQIDRTFSVRSD